MPVRLMYEKTVLPNGLRVVSSTMPHTRSASVSIFVGAGSRYESDEIAGVSHFLEHMLFKGTRRRPTAREISEEIEGIGGVMNAGTDKELTVYWAKVGDHRFANTIDLLADSLRNSLLDPLELEKERAVILEELAMTEDSPGEIVSLLIDEVVWPNQPLGRDTGGSPDSVRAITRDDVIRYMEELYTPQNTVVAVAGNVSHQEVVDRAAEHLGDWETRPHGRWYPADIPDDTPRVRLRTKKTEQAHICLGLPGVSSAHPDRYALDVLNSVLGEGMSSRLFLELREQRGLCYDVHSYVNHYLDTGSAVISASVDPRNVAEALRSIVDEIEKMSDRIPEKELTKAKEFIKGRLQLRMEDTRAVASWLGGQELLRREILTVDDVLTIVDDVQLDELQRVAQYLLRPDQFRLALVGPYRSEARFEKLLAA
ncbi:MAG TPA: pitrilysin family protein [Chloroflexota bacterium]|nr:pitrilysin family protein [Chloroflexota bacterium]